MSLAELWYIQRRKVVLRHCNAVLSSTKRR
jgi:hypothetical protein